MEVFLEKLRRVAFRGLDIARGGKLAWHLREIGRVLQKMSPAEVSGYHQQKLDRLLHHAVSSTEFYQQKAGFESIADFEVIDKNTIRDHLSEFLSAKKSQLQPVVTSGSTGTPFTVWQDKNKRLRNLADTIFFAGKAGFELGQKLVYLKVWNDINRKGCLNSWMQNIVPQDVTHLPEESIQQILKTLASGKSKKAILGYASALEVISSYIELHDLDTSDFHIGSIVAMSEAIDDRTKAKLREQFGVAVVSRYSNVENGILAQQCLEDNVEFHLNVASYFFELLELDSDRPAKAGEPGRIVVTDLFNFGTPMIRYDTGDMAMFSDQPRCGFKTPVFTQVEGRRMDAVFDTSNKIVSSFTITNNLWNYPEILQYQFLQTGAKSYKFRLNVRSGFAREAELKQEFKTYFGQDAEITVEYVSGIPLLSSGKRKKVVNVYHGNNGNGRS